MNRLSKAMGYIERLPSNWQPTIRSFLLGRIIHFAGTASCRVVTLRPETCVIRLKNRRKVQNHIGSVHAAAIALLAESATGFMTGMTVPDSRILVIRSMELTYLSRASGAMTAVASFSTKQLDYIRNTPKGDISVPVVITDETGKETAKAEMIWAWKPKK